MSPSVCRVSSHRAGWFGGTAQWLRSALKQKNHQRGPRRLKLQARVRPSEKRLTHVQPCALFAYLVIANDLHLNLLFQLYLTPSFHSSSVYNILMFAVK